MNTIETSKLVLLLELGVLCGYFIIKYPIGTSVPCSDESLYKRVHYKGFNVDEKYRIVEKPPNRMTPQCCPMYKQWICGTD